MRILVLHSDLGPDALPHDLDTLSTSEAIAQALRAMGHTADLVPFELPPARTTAQLRRFAPDIVFNMVETIDACDAMASLAPAVLDREGWTYTGAGAAAMALAADKPAAKRMLRAAGLPTPDWSAPPRWLGPEEGDWIVKSATEDSSIGLDDDAVVGTMAAARARAEECRRRFGGRWFAERYIDGREFNVAVLERDGRPCVLPLAEMVFRDWPHGKPAIVSYRAKWEEGSRESDCTVRRFGCEREDADLAAAITDAALKAWDLFGLAGYARIDFRIDKAGSPFILEINPNPCLATDAGFAAAASRDELSYAALLEAILAAARGKMVTR